MKKQFEEPIITIEQFEIEDVITTSGRNEGPIDPDN